MLLVSAQLVGAPNRADGAHRSDSPGHWVGSWATAQHTTKEQLEDQTVKMILHLTQGGDLVRVRIANTLGSEPIEIGAATVGIRESGASIVEGTLRPLTFDGAGHAQVPAGGSTVSDPVRLSTEAQQDLVTSIHVPGTVTPSAHETAFDTGYLTEAHGGDHSSDLGGDAFTVTTSSYLMVSAADVSVSGAAGSIVVVGGSVVDGQGSRAGGAMGSGPAAPPNSRWSDVLARRILTELPDNAQPAGVNAGVGGNTASRECTGLGLWGDRSEFGNLEDRFERDVLAISGVRDIIIYAGTNDIGNGCTADQIIAAFTRLTERAHLRGIKVVIATITPRATYTPERNQERSAVNYWLLRGGNCGGVCDGVVNFDAAISWSLYPNAIDPIYDSGDTIHPNADGYRRMGQSVDLRLFDH